MQITHRSEKKSYVFSWQGVRTHPTRLVLGTPLPSDDDDDVMQYRILGSIMDSLYSLGLVFLILSAPAQY